MRTSNGRASVRRDSPDLIKVLHPPNQQRRAMIPWPDPAPRHHRRHCHRRLQSGENAASRGTTIGDAYSFECQAHSHRFLVDRLRHLLLLFHRVALHLHKVVVPRPTPLVRESLDRHSCVSVLSHSRTGSDGPHRAAWMGSVGARPPVHPSRDHQICGGSHSRLRPIHDGEQLLRIPPLESGSTTRSGWKSGSFVACFWHFSCFPTHSSRNSGLPRRTLNPGPTGWAHYWWASLQSGIRARCYTDTPLLPRLLVAQQSNNARRPNILVIGTDAVSADLFSLYGGKNTHYTVPGFHRGRPSRRRQRAAECQRVLGLCVDSSLWQIACVHQGIDVSGYRFSQQFLRASPTDAQDNSAIRQSSSAFVTGPTAST